MTRDARITCAVCAWRGDCRKKFTITSALHCHDFTRDVTLKETPPDDDEKEKHAAEQEKDHTP
jgi:hypothetical protein